MVLRFSHHKGGPTYWGRINTGDLLLQEAAGRLKESLREIDVVSRLGGDEFLILVEKVHSQTDAARIAQKLLMVLDSPFNINGRQLTISASIGISMFPDDAKTASILIQHADMAMYKAKERGKNYYYFFKQELSDRATQRFQVESDLRHAIQDKQLVVFYQPQYSLSNGRLTGLEALSRWTHPERGTISPDEFIPVAEESGLIIPLTEWMIEQAIIDWKDLVTNLKSIPQLSINISSHCFHMHGLVSLVKELIDRHDIVASHLELEITETSLMQNADRAFNILVDLKKLGVHIAIDDFGTGYSSLSYLQKFPIDTVKIDRSFVKEIVHQPDVATMVSAIIRMCHTLGLDVISEGVESISQMAMLTEQGCDIVQGYIYSQPIPPEKVTILLQREM
ncbi:putative bifunctional diguanylate cyclase/phosphodiesterase [Solemya velum gill symbiont]|uniref:putative bifunctional diguanylate cyclase/phosphodiesterase n=1 Tax=Solemya velum gill symbiont TaxID=2340 RepID=UPI000998DD38|nr:bifunctional diguanylate cyclase/phosphodiesterase [Solemya velum gill symbiont]OOZ43594.1 hypothetical protein BOW37_10360 [Solemya velum gill symbiont]OOZ45043.1 hypothetical protein BOW38_10520 [Solemya velum gill symbiont]OOZ50462.1 hypothetical protein BOW40_10365 [Solemya velum gill symbiont]OOZ53361.1 hypothetical protein BOW41_10595 [Solemya velum gill symbiont]OOZ68261.1 hypothetical protein BOW47_10525 [Solemya velum gill symbiont]